MPINLLNNYDKYGFTLRSVTRMFYEEWHEPHIEIKYVANNKRKNINFCGFPFKTLVYSIKTDNKKEIVQDLYNKIKDLDILETTKFLLHQYPNEAESIIYSIPSYILTNNDFFSYLNNYIDNFPENIKQNLNRSIKMKLNGIQKYLNAHDSGLIL